MRIALNGTGFSNRPSGARQRFVEIYGRVVRNMEEAEFVVFEPSDCRVSEWLGSENVIAISTPVSSERSVQKWIRSASYWRAISRDHPLDLFESFNLPAMRVGRANWLTIHDIRRLRSIGSMTERSIYRLALSRALRNIDLVITVSQAMREEIHEFFPDARVEVVYNGIDPALFSPPEQQEIASVGARYALPERFALTVGHLEERKNLARLIEAVHLANHRGEALHLVIVGRDSGEHAALQRLITKRQLDSRVQVLTDVRDSDLRAIYAMSSLFVFPSRYEGFGIPLLEAMASGTPLVVSDIPVFRELAGNAGIYFDPLQPEDIADRLLDVLCSAPKAQVLVDNGLLRLQRYAPESLARQISDLYRSL